MNGLDWPAPAPCARIKAASIRGSAAAYTTALTCASPSIRTGRSVRWITPPSHFRIGPQLVGHRQRVELRGERLREPAIDLAAHQASKRHAAAIDDDVDGRVAHDRIVPEVGVAVDGARYLLPQRVVEAGRRQHAELVNH